MAGQLLPVDFRCPISLEVMTDPVILSSGHTFDRSSIQRWLDSGHRTCPITKRTLPTHPYLIPNYALRSLISNYTILSPTKIAQTQHGDRPQALISTLTSRSSDVVSKLDSLCRLVKLSKRDSAFRRQLAESGTLSVVLRYVDSEDLIMQEKALNLVLNLSLDDDNKVGLVAEGALTKIVAALSCHSANCRALAATIITSLAVVEVNKATIGEYPFAIDSLISLLKDGNDREKKEAATAIFSICSFPDNRKRAVVRGAVPILLQVADSGLERAVEVLYLLTKCKEGREAMEIFPVCLGVLVGFLKNGGFKGVQSSLLSLYSLCCYSEWMYVEVRRKGVVEICTRLLEDDNEKIRINASNLILLLLQGEVSKR